MIKPYAADDVFLAALNAPASRDALRIAWLGQSGFLLECNTQRVLLDPYLSDSLTKKYAETQKPHVRMTARVVAPERLTRIHLVTSSHTHTDHLDAETLKPLIAANPGIQMVIPEATRELVVQRIACEHWWPIGLDHLSSKKISGIQVHGIAAAHNELSIDSRGQNLFLGYVLQFGSWTVYHSGDTLLHPDLVPALAGFTIDVAFLPINGNDPSRGVAGNLDGKEAVHLAQEIGAKLVIPCHYEMFTFNTADPNDLFIPCCHERSIRYEVMAAGQILELQPPRT